MKTCENRLTVVIPSNWESFDSPHVHSETFLCQTKILEKFWAFYFVYPGNRVSWVQTLDLPYLSAFMHCLFCLQRQTRNTLLGFVIWLKCFRSVIIMQCEGSNLQIWICKSKWPILLHFLHRTYTIHSADFPPKKNRDFIT